MLRQFERARLTKEYVEMRQEEKKERKKAKLKNVEIMSKSFNQRDLRLICMYCSLEIVITRH